MTRAAFSMVEVKRAISALKSCGEIVRGVDVRKDGSFRVLTEANENVSDDAALDAELAEIDKRGRHGR